MKPFFFRYPVLQVLESLLVRRTEVKEVGIRGYVERHLFETVETLIYKRKLFFKLKVKYNYIFAKRSLL